MSNRNPSITLPSRKTAVKTNGQDSQSCNGHACDLNCIVQPRFFCGQLLTDQDLAAIVTWAEDKFRLNRFRDGWGIACGLDVRCDHTNPGHIIIEPGYAIDCCGNDIIVCEPASVDLSDACCPEKDPCEKFGEGDDGYGRFRKADVVQQLHEEFVAMSKSDKFQRETGRLYVDIYLNYAEKGTQAVANLRKNGCHHDHACEPTRIQESFTINWRLAEVGNPTRYAVKKWLNQYLKCVEVVKAFAVIWEKWLSQEPELEELVRRARSWLLYWLEEHPLFHFCFIRDMICDLTAEHLTYDYIDQILRNIVLGIALDCRIRFLNENCALCADDTGIPLARVLLFKEDDECDIFKIDAFSPYRRSLAPDQTPTMPGTVNGGQIFWQTYEEACVTLRGLGVNVVGKIDMSDETDMFAIDKLLSQSPFIPVCPETPVKLVTLDYFDSNRVVGFLWDADDVIIREVEKDEKDVREDERDDLSVISGISKKRAEVLYEANIRTFNKLSRTPTLELKKIFSSVGETPLRKWREDAAKLAEEKKRSRS